LEWSGPFLVRSVLSCQVQSALLLSAPLCSFCSSIFLSCLIRSSPFLSLNSSLYYSPLLSYHPLSAIILFSSL